MPAALWLKLVGGALVIVGVAWLVNLIRADGARDFQSGIERQNNDAAIQADGAVLDYDRCRDAGRVFDFRTGKCAGLKASGRN